MIPALMVRELVAYLCVLQRAQSASVDGASNVQCHVLTELLRVDGLTQQALMIVCRSMAWISPRGLILGV